MRHWSRYSRTVIANGPPFVSGQMRDCLAAIGEAACISLSHTGWCRIPFDWVLPSFV
jgi:hypothetical protein